MGTEDFDFLLNYDKSKPFAAYVKQAADFAYGANLPDDRVPDTFLAVVVDDAIVGRLSIRHQLNDFLAHEGGHVGYGILPEYRRKGYATETLRQGLIVARSLGIDPALVICDDDNVGSATVIERCGGELVDRVTTSDDVLARRYHVAL